MDSQNSLRKENAVVTGYMANALLSKNQKYEVKPIKHDI
jgi:hypothetical protein